jgi:hypothetical protein
MEVRGPLVTLAAVAALGVVAARARGQRHREPGLLFFGLVYVWLTSALWFFQINGITF